ncbi:MAG: hypothetical protein ABIF85_03580 [Nanoarchaeota archaeon]|nr:hypothetical protein [Nanoarchaeota archaeon]MBU4300823.1 hypothetical protein [Nanoarchaeota archaeon]MBU4451498.1 hypothetical protein [Nanoarchaeota archaeon]MCG2723851.1 hypothetical protein [archaeon]
MKTNCLMGKSEGRLSACERLKSEYEDAHNIIRHTFLTPAVADDDLKRHAKTCDFWFSTKRPEEAV